MLIFTAVLGVLLFIGIWAVIERDMKRSEWIPGKDNIEYLVKSVMAPQSKEIIVDGKGNRLICMYEIESEVPWGIYMSRDNTRMKLLGGKAGRYNINVGPISTCKGDLYWVENESFSKEGLVGVKGEIIHTTAERSCF